MGVYRRFGQGDILYSSIQTRPRVTIRRDESGWTGSTGPSGSMSLYGGIRARFDVGPSNIGTSGVSIYPLDPVDTHSIDRVIYVSGTYPSTGSVRVARCLNQAASSFLDINDEEWYEEHFRPIERLYEYYVGRDSSYFMGSYDFYSTLLLNDFSDISTSSLPLAGPHFIFSGAFNEDILDNAASFTAAAWVKPLITPTPSSSITVRGTIMSQKGLWSLENTQSGTLLFRYDGNVLLSSNRLNNGYWNTAGVIINSGTSLSFYVNGVVEATQSLPAPLLTGSHLQPLIVGASRDSTTGKPYWGFNGFLFDTRVYSSSLSQADLNTSMSGTILNSGSNLLHYSRFNDGPYGNSHGLGSGSGAFDFSPNEAPGMIYNWSPDHIVRWEPGDHPTFVPLLRKTNLDIADIRVVHIPSMFYGRQIDPLSVTISDGVFNSRGITRVLSDDGRGSLYVSGSMTEPISGEQYTGERRRKVGNVFYTEGLITITDPAFHDMLDENSAFWDPSVSVSGTIGDLFSIDFKGQNTIHTKTFNCRMGAAQFNSSNNPTYGVVADQGTEDTEDDRMVTLREDGTTYITAVGIYNERRELVAVAKLAQPIRKREKDKNNIRLKIDI